MPKTRELSNDERSDVNCLVPTVKHSPGVMVWGCFTRSRIGPLILVEGRITGETFFESIYCHSKKV